MGRARLYRSRRDRWLSGLLGGLGEYFGFSSTALRVIAVFSVFFTGGTTLFIYLIASLVVSKEPYDPYNPFQSNSWQGGPGNGGYGGHNGYGGSNGYGANSNGGFGGYGGGFSGGIPGSPGQPGAGFGPRRPEQQQQPSNLDSMMQDIEKKAMKKELEELRKKLAEYEKGEV